MNLIWCQCVSTKVFQLLACWSSTFICSCLQIKKVTPGQYGVSQVCKTFPGKNKTMSVQLRMLGF